MQTQPPVLACLGQERIKPMQQQLSHSKPSKLFDAPVRSTPDQVRVIVTWGCNLRQRQLQQGEHLKKRCKLWAPTWKKAMGWAPEAG